ncbi:oxidoreductase [Pusillimonas sp. T2]|uniref:NAD(P)-binding domain-containing protein n=1 Tax=Pusillimonas sp. T2 TaxID=1548123 RepID=UPI000B946868|nr:NAD(P)/FAD-dependent oxidoreductase [Pusillimonas sp. T2]OXR48212.1 oxidoreductase [Pusillimonas sp. T2]
MSLSALEQRLINGLDYLNFPRREWVPRREHCGQRVLDVAIIGAGQSGLATAFGLRLENIKNVVVLDKRQPETVGPWRTFARMKTLRTPKFGSGLDFGNPDLTPQAWYEARFGKEAWNALGKMPTDLWHEYLEWYRRALSIPVQYGVTVESILPDSDCLRLTCAGGEIIFARRVVLATGLDGSGRWYLPPIVNNLPKACYGHTEERIDFSALKGRRVGVLGGGASAFDNAATAIEAGARSVDLCIRAPQLPRINPNKWMEFSGFLGHYAELTDDRKWRFMHQIGSMLQPPPQETLWRCNRHEQFALHTGSPWLEAWQSDSCVGIKTPHREFEFDFLIFGTGLTHDLKCRPELSGIAEEVALWQDRFRPAEGLEAGHLMASPYLGPGFEFLEKRPGAAPHLGKIYNFTHGAMLSLGLNAASITGMKYGVRRLVRALSCSLFIEDADEHFDSLTSYTEPEIWTLDPEAVAQKKTSNAA